MVFLVVIALGAASSYAATVKVLILPFDMHGSEDITDLRREVMEKLAVGIDMLGGEVVGIGEIRELIKNEGVLSFDEKSAQDIAASVGMDFAIFGSVTKIEKTINVELASYGH